MSWDVVWCGVVQWLMNCDVRCGKACGLVK